MTRTRIPSVRRLGVAGTATVAVAASLALASPASAAVGATVNNGTLTVVGNGASDQIALRLAPGNANLLQLDVGDDGSAEQSFDRTLFTRIVVNAGGGNDRIRIDQVNGSFADEETTLDGQGGNDTIEGGDASEVLLGGGGNDLIDGNRGNDTGILGSGHDTFRWDPGDGSDVVEGQSGVDVLDFNGANVAERMSLSPNGTRVRFFRDVANITMDLNDVERLDLTALGGVDTFSVDDMSGTDMKLADVDLSAATGGGDGAADTVTVNGTDGSDSMNARAVTGRVVVDGLATKVRVAGSEKANDNLQIDGQGGNDEILVRRGADALMGIHVDL